MRTDKPTPYHILRDRDKASAHRRHAVAEVNSGAEIKEVARRYGVSR